MSLLERFATPSGLASSSRHRASSAPYQPLAQDEALPAGQGLSRASSSQHHSPHSGLHQDPAALMLLRLGRSPNERIAVSPVDDARILRRIDWALLPLMLAVYFLQALDKATLSYASIFGLIDDTKLVGDQYSWLGSIVYLAQLVMQLPMALALVKLPIGKFTSVMVLAWGITLAAMAGAHDFRRLLVARFFLGAFEASIGPAFIAITQMWWRRREQTMRIGFWYCMNGLTWVFGSLITYGLAHIQSPMKPYQIIFLFFGLVTVAVGGLMFSSFPDSLPEAKFLSDDDKVLAIERLRGNEMGIMTRRWRGSHCLETVTDAKTWLWVALIFCVSVPSNGISTFGPLIVQSFVSDPFRTILFNIPVGVSHLVAVSGSAYLSMRWKRKGPVILLLCIPPILGFSILLCFPHDAAHRAVLLAGYFCLSTLTGITPLIYSWSSQNTGGETKRKSTSALVFVGASAGNIIGPLLFRPDEAPNYGRGLRINLVLFAVVMVLVGATTLYIHWLNREHGRRRVALGKRANIADTSLETAPEVERMQASDRVLDAGPEPDDVEEAEGGPEDGPERRENLSFSDLTDLENEDFLFVF